VYYISRGKVKPANKAFAAVRNDYTINLDNGYLLLRCLVCHAHLAVGHTRVQILLPACARFVTALPRVCGVAGAGCSLNQWCVVDKCKSALSVSDRCWTGCCCRAEIEVCEDADASKMQARPNFVPIDQLPSFIGKKARTTSLADTPLISSSSVCPRWGCNTEHVLHGARLQ
jgi:hypothetical protein